LHQREANRQRGRREGRQIAGFSYRAAAARMRFHPNEFSLRLKAVRVVTQE